MPKLTNERGDPALVERIVRALGDRQARTGEVLTWKALGEAVGLSPSSMSDLRYLRRAVGVAEGRVLAEALGVRAAWLLLGEGPMRDEGGGGATRAADAPKAPPVIPPEMFRKVERAPGRKKRPGSA